MNEVAVSNLHRCSLAKEQHHLHIIPCLKIINTLEPFVDINAKVTEVYDAYRYSDHSICERNK